MDKGVTVRYTYKGDVSAYAAILYVKFKMILFVSAEPISLADLVIASENYAERKSNMKITVVFDYPEISDPEGEDADWAADSLTDDLKKLGNEGEYEWYIDDVVE
jgi:hypothetical protein